VRCRTRPCVLSPCWSDRPSLAGWRLRASSDDRAAALKIVDALCGYKRDRCAPCALVRKVPSASKDCSHSPRMRSHFSVFKSVRARSSAHSSPSSCKSDGPRRQPHVSTRLLWSPPVVAEVTFDPLHLSRRRRQHAAPKERDLGCGARHLPSGFNPRPWTLISYLHPKP